MHLLTVVTLATTGWLMGLGWPYWLGVLAVAGLLIYEHSLISPTDLSKLGFAFFNINGYIALTIFVATLLAVSL
jgi:4-hydroxybenzoate polyprenyltransferase